MAHASTKWKLSGVSALALATLLSGCGTSPDAPAPSDSGTTVDAKTATSLANFGTLADLEAAAKAEGALNVIALPRDWANYGAVLDAFKAKYPEITIIEQSPDAASAEEIKAAKTNEGLDTAPDVFDLGLAVTLQNQDMFAPYKVQTWADIPDWAKEASGLYVGDYGGYMAVGFDSTKLSEPKTITDLLKPEYKGKVAINGDPTQAGSAFNSIALATILNGGTLDDFSAGIDFFSQMNKVGNFLKVNPTTATITSGETPMVIDWDYLLASQGATVEGWKVVAFPEKGIAGYYNQAINKGAPHPAAARLWEEFLYSDQGQNLWLAGGARPIRMDAMTTAGTIDAAAASALPAPPSDPQIPTAAQNEAAGGLLGEKWTAAISS